METLKNVIIQKNPYVNQFIMACERLKNENISNLKIVLRADAKSNNAHSRKYNLPYSYEIAVIISGTWYGTETVGNRDIILHARCGGLQRIHETHRLYDTLHYVIIYSTGEHGW